MSETVKYRQLLIGLAYLAAYLALDYVSYVKPYRDLGITPWNPPPGLSIAFVFLQGARAIPFALVAPALADALIRGTPLGWSLGLLSSVLIGGTYALAGLWLQRISAFDPRFRAVRDTLALTGVGVVTSAVAACLFVAILLSAGMILRDELFSVAWRAAVGDLIGILTIVPLVLLWRTHRPWPKFGPWTPVQALAVLVALAIVFGYREATAFQLFYLLFLPVLWVALSHGPPGAVVVLLLVQIGIVIGAEIRFGPDPGFGALQVLMIALAITGLIVATIVAEREDTAARMRDQQAALNRALRIRSAGEIAATIAHEMNQPLTALNTYTGIAMKAMDDGDTSMARNVLSKVQTECGRATAVLTGIRELLRQGTLTRRPFKVKEAFDELQELLQADLAKRGVTLSFRVADNAPLLNADRVQLQQAVHNLVINGAEAIQSVGQSGRVNVEASCPDGRDWIIEVRDDGPGFPPGYDLLDPTPFTSTKSDGSGIGLAVVRSIAEAHGGKMAIASNARGSTVQLTLPYMGAPND
jgi:signal transduction histidine kinase